MSFIVISLLLCGGVMFFVSMLEGAVKVRRFGESWVISNRDRDLSLDQTVHRAHRAKINTLEAMALFVPALAAAGFSGSIGMIGKLAVIAFILARILYPFLYIGGYPMARTTVWTIGMSASAVVGIGALV